jgi:hypothetical protein
MPGGLEEQAGWGVGVAPQDRPIGYLKRRAFKVDELNQLLGADMKLQSVDGNLSSGNFFKPVAIGYVIGMGVFFLPIILMTIPMMILMPGVEGESQSMSMALSGLIMVPFILILQSVMFGGLVVLGLSIYRLRWPIRITNKTQTASDLPGTPPPNQ